MGTVAAPASARSTPARPSAPSRQGSRRGRPPLLTVPAAHEPQLRPLPVAVQLPHRLCAHVGVALGRHDDGGVGAARPGVPCHVRLVRGVA